LYVLDRWIHVPSGRVYNLTYNPPKVPFKDDITGEYLSKRQDDEPDIVRVRLKKYYETISPILNYYKELEVLYEVQGETSDSIYPTIKKLVENALKKEVKIQI
jgi:adenylate kinase